MGLFPTHALRYNIRMNTDEEQSKILEQLELLNVKISRQNSVRHIFTTGIIYGVGFFIGSAILATIALGILGPWIGKIDWIRDNFEKGSSLYGK